MFTCDFPQSTQTAVAPAHIIVIFNKQPTMTSLQLHKVYIRYISWSQSCLSRKLALAVRMFDNLPILRLSSSQHSKNWPRTMLVICWRAYSVHLNKLVTSTAICMSLLIINVSSDTSSPSGAARQPSPSTCSPAGITTTGMYDVALSLF